MIKTKHAMAQMLVNEFEGNSLPLTNIKYVTKYNEFNLGQYSIGDWYYGKNYTFFHRKYENETYPTLLAYNEKGELVFSQELNYHIHKLYIDEDGYFYGITSTNSTTTDYKLTLFNRIEEENEINRRKSYTLSRNNITHAPDVIKKDDSNYFITSIEDNVGGYRTMLIWQLIIDIKNGNQWKYWQNEFDHEKDTAEIKYSFDFSVENSIIIRFCFAETSTISEGSLNKQIQIERANLLLTDEDLDEQGTQKKTKLLLSEVLDTFKLCVSNVDVLPENFVYMIDNNLFATLKIVKNDLNSIPEYQIKYWYQNGEQLTYSSYPIEAKNNGEYLITSFSWKIKNKALVVAVPSVSYTHLVNVPKYIRIYTYLLEFGLDNVPQFKLCKLQDNSEYVEYDTGLLSYYNWKVFFNLINIVKIKERWYITIGILSRSQETSASATNNNSINITFVIDNVYYMRESKLCNVPDLMQVNDVKSLLAKMQIQYYEGSGLVSVFNIPNNVENGNINNLKFFDEYDQEFCEHETNVEKNEYENVYVYHKEKYNVLNNNTINKEASLLALNLLADKNRQNISVLPYIRWAKLSFEGGQTILLDLDNDNSYYEISGNRIIFTFQNTFNDNGKVELLSNDSRGYEYAQVYFSKDFNIEQGTITITCTIN